MKKILSLFLSVLITLSVFSGLNFSMFIVNAEEEVTETIFPYSDSDVYVADNIIKGIIDNEGIAHSFPEINIALTHKFAYERIAEELVDDELMMFNSLYWQNIKKTLSADFVSMANWEEELCVLLVIDFLNYYGQTEEFESNYVKNTVKFTEAIIKDVIDYAANEYVDVKGPTNQILATMTVEESKALTEKWGFIKELKKYSTLISDIEKVSKSATQYYKNLTKALSVQRADEARIDFLKELKETGSSNTHFVNAIDKVIAMYESSYATLTLGEGTRTMLNHGMTVLFDEALKRYEEIIVCTDASTIIKELKVYKEGLNWIFNSDDISENNLKLVLIYTIGNYAKSAVYTKKSAFESNPTVENAQAFINAYKGYLKYQAYASESVKGFISSALFDGIFNNIKNAFSDKNIQTYNDFMGLIDTDKTIFCKLEGLVQKHYNRYFAILDYDCDAITEDHMFENPPTNIAVDEVYSDDITYNLMVSGDSAIDDSFTLSDDLNIFGDLYLKGGTLDLNGSNLSINGNLYHSGGTLNIHGGTLKVTKDYRIQTYEETTNDGEMIFGPSQGYLVMNNERDMVKIGGDFYIQSSYSNYNELTNGTFELSGDFYQDDYGDFYSNNDHTVIFAGDRSHNVYIASTNVHFNNLVVESGSLIWSGYLNTYKIDSDIDITADDLIINSIWDMNKKNVVINGDVAMDGSVDINYGKLTINGNLYHSGGTLNIHGGTLEVTEDYRIQTYEETTNDGEMIFGPSEGHLFMTNERDLVKIGGNFYVENTGHNELTKGTFELSGDFYQDNYNYGDFYGDSDHTVIFTGDRSHNVYVASTTVRFSNLIVEGGSLIWSGYLNIYKIDSDIDITADDLIINSIWDMNKKNVVINGDVTMDGSVDINYGKLTIDGNLYHSGGTMNIHGGTLEVTEDYRIQTYEETTNDGEMIFGPSEGHLIMTNERDLVKIGGDFYTQSTYSDSYNELSNGTMMINGDLSQLSSDGAHSSNFICYGEHTVVLNGTEVQRVTFESVSSHINKLKLTKDILTGYIFNPNECWHELYLDTDVKSVSIINISNSLQQGKSLLLTASVNGINNPTQSVEWTIAGNTDSNTKISVGGILTVGTNEQAEEITVTATSVADPTKSASVIINIIKVEPIVNGVVINPAVVSSVCGETCSFDAVVYGLYNPPQTVIWFVTGNKSSDTRISEDGVLSIAENETSDKLTVIAQSDFDVSKSAQVDVTVIQVNNTPVETPPVTSEPSADILEFYLVGYINGADYGIGLGFENLGEYKFVNGKVTVNFTEESYVIVKDSNLNCYCTNGWLGFDTTSAVMGDYGSKMNDKLYVPKGVYTLSFDPATMVLSYYAETDETYPLTSDEIEPTATTAPETEGTVATDPSEITTDAPTTTVPATEAKKTYVVMFVDHDNTLLSVQTVVEGESAVAPADPTRAG
ncbi:MAG: hypothetical protein IKK10_04090, partial [Clostridia bacterium]|nr:hypothetical protein [Clostridia bacterium]